MKKLILLIYFLFLAGNVFSQNVKELEIINPVTNEEPQYDFRYDKLTGTYVYTLYDTTINKSMFISNKGNSRYYDYCGAYNIQFNSEGDYFGLSNTYYEDYKNDKNHLISNGSELMTFSYIEQLVIKNDILYIISKADEKSMFLKYNTLTKKLEYEKIYDEINLVYIPDVQYGEPVFELGFTKEGEEYFAAKNDNKSFLVIGGKEQEKFDEINPFGVVTDKAGVITYIATKITDEIRESFVIQGTKKYRSFPAIIEFIKFTNDNIPVYGISDDTAYSYFTKQYVTGNTQGKSYNAGVWGLGNTPSGKIYYIATDSTSSGKYSSRIVIDGVEGKTYDAVYNLRFTKNDEPVFIITENQMEVLVHNDNEIGTEFNYIFGVTISPNDKIGYVGVISSDDTSIPERYFFVIDGKRYGPFISVPYGMMEGFFEMITFNDFDDYAFAATDEQTRNYENQKFTLYSNKFDAPGSFSYVNEIYTDGIDFYYTTATGINETETVYDVYKNDRKIAGGYTLMTNFNFDKENKKISCIGFKKGAYYYIEIEL